MKNLSIREIHVLSALASMALVLFQRMDWLLEEPRGGESMGSRKIPE